VAHRAANANDGIELVGYIVHEATQARTPMPPKPNTLTTRQCCSTSQLVKREFGFAPVKGKISGASPRSTRARLE
jgi:hypothetical protein